MDAYTYLSIMTVSMALVLGWRDWLHYKALTLDNKETPEDGR